jgi:mRNA interferase MazF
MTRRGDVVLFDFPYADGTGSKVRPALVVQNDVDNRRLKQTILAMITGNTRHAREPTQLLIDTPTPDGKASGLAGTSAVKCSVLVTVVQSDVKRTIGRLSDGLMDAADDCLKAALDLL